MSYQAVPLGAAEGPKAPKPTILTIQVEKLRLIAYFGFWGFVAFSVIVSKFTVFPYMSCVIDGVDKFGAECTDLKRVFGFNNICINWDYSPSVQLTGMVYPIFEYSLLLYILLDYCQIKNDMLNGIFPAQKAKLMKTMFWIKVTDGPITIGALEIPAVVAHTLGFWGLQWGLVLIAFENVLYLTYRKQGMWCFSPESTVKLAYLYLTLLASLTALKFIWSASIFASETGTPIIPNALARYFDRGWMLLAAVCPIFFALNGMKKDPPMVITIVNADVRK